MTDTPSRGNPRGRGESSNPRAARLRQSRSSTRSSSAPSTSRARSRTTTRNQSSRQHRAPQNSVNHPADQSNVHSIVEHLVQSGSLQDVLDEVRSRQFSNGRSERTSSSTDENTVQGSQDTRTRQAIGHGLTCFRRFATILTVIATLVLVAMLGGKMLIHEQIRKSIEQALNDHYQQSGVVVSVGAVRFIEGRGFDVSALRFSHPKQAFVQDSSSRSSDVVPIQNEAMISIDRLFLKSSASLVDVLQRRVEIEAVVIDNVRADIRRDDQGVWNLESLFPMPESGGKPVPIKLSNGQVSVSWSQEDFAKRVVFSNIEFGLAFKEALTPSVNQVHYSIAQQQSSDGPSSFERSSSDTLIPASPSNLDLQFDSHRNALSDYTQSLDQGAPYHHEGDSYAVDESEVDVMPLEFVHEQLSALNIEGMEFRLAFSTERIGEASFAGSIDRATNSFRLDYSGDQIRLDDGLLSMVPADMFPQLETLRSFNGKLSVHGFVDGPLDFSATPLFVCDGTLRDGQIHEDRLPYPLDGIKANYHIDNDSFEISDVTARFGSSRLSVSCEGGIFGLSDRPFQVTVIGEQIRLSEEMAQCLPESLQSVWNDFNPSGLANVTISARIENESWVPELQLDLIDVSILPRAFPYRVDSCAGRITWQNGRCEVDLNGLVSGRVATFKGAVDKDASRLSEITITLNEAIPIDEKLLRALSVNQSLERSIRAFDPTGLMTCVAILRRADNRSKLKVDHLTIDVLDGSVNYVHVPYPVGSVSGTITFDQGTVRFLSLNGRNDNGSITCNGRLESSGELDVTLTGSGVLMDTELHAAMPDSIQQIWDNLRPEGTIDRGLVHVTRADKFSPIQFGVELQNYRNQERAGTRLSIQPVWFPYRMRNVAGVLDYRNGEIAIHGFHADVGGATVSAEGGGFASPAGWHTVFRNLAVDGLVIDQPFLDAMPASLRKTFEDLQIEGFVNVFGQLVLSQTTHLRDAPRFGIERSEENGTELPVAQSSFGDSRQLKIPGSTVLVEWDVIVDMDGAQFSAGRDFENVFGSVRLVGYRDEQGSYQMGQFNVDSLVVDGIQVTNVSGPLRIEPGLLAIGRWAELSSPGIPPQSVTANVFDGLLRFDARVELNERREFYCQAILSDAELASIGSELARQMDDVSGTAFATINLRGNTLGVASYEGSGSVRLTDAHIYEIPLILSMLKVLSIRQPSSTAFTTSNIDFVIRGEQIDLPRIEFLGDAISLKGFGEMDFSREIDLTFYSIVGREELRIPVIRDLFGAASQSILEINVDGTLEEPNIRQRPFPGFNDTLQQLFPEIEQDAIQPVVPGIPSIGSDLSRIRLGGRGQRSNIRY